MIVDQPNPDVGGDARSDLFSIEGSLHSVRPAAFTNISKSSRHLFHFDRRCHCLQRIREKANIPVEESSTDQGKLCPDALFYKRVETKWISLNSCNWTFSGHFIQFFHHKSQTRQTDSKWISLNSVQWTFMSKIATES
jgi:hypothetical protein